MKDREYHGAQTRHSTLNKTILSKLCVLLDQTVSWNHESSQHWLPSHKTWSPLVLVNRTLLHWSSACSHSVCIVRAKARSSYERSIVRSALLLPIELTAAWPHSHVQPPQAAVWFMGSPSQRLRWRGWWRLSMMKERCHEQLSHRYVMHSWEVIISQQYKSTREALQM